MTTPTDSIATTAAPRQAPRTGAAVRDDAPNHRTLLWQAALLGVSGDALLRQGLVGPGLALWIGVLALATLSLTWNAGRRVPRESALWLAAAVLLAALTAWRASDALRAFDVLATVGALGFAAVSLRDPRRALLAERLRETLWAGVAVVRNVARGIVPLALRELFSGDHRADVASRARVATRLALVAGAILLVFGSLLRGADPIFARLVRLPDIDVGTVASHVVLAGFFAWVAGGWAYGALVESPARGRAPDRLPVSLGALDVTTALGTLGVLFAAYVLTQLGWFFGGERFLRETTGLTAAQYARKGFFQMVWVVALVVPLLLVTRAALAPERSLARRHTALALPIVALLGVMILSAALRMRLYVHYYGLTTDRLYTLVIMGWLTFVLLLLAATVLRDRGRAFVAGSVLSALAVLLAMHVVVPELVVARVNLARAESSGATTRLDLPYLSTLGGDVAPLAVAATLAPARAADRIDPAAADERCAAASRLLNRWGPGSHAAVRREAEGAWRWWNAGEARALEVVGASATDLRAVAHSTCTSGWEGRVFRRGAVD
jgi:hypothetical protein